MLGAPVKDFLIIWRRQTHPKSGAHLWYQPSSKDMGEGSFAFCLLALTLAGKFTYPVAVVSIKFNSFRIPIETGSTPGILSVSSPRWGLQSHSAFWTRQLPDFQPSHSRTDIVGLCRCHPISQSNKSYHNWQMFVFCSIIHIHHTHTHPSSSVPFENPDRLIVSISVR